MGKESLVRGGFLSRGVYIVRFFVLNDLFFF